MQPDAILLVSFGGPEGPDDVMPFLRNVTRGKNIPDDRLHSVAHHYHLFGGVSPINQQNRDLISALRRELKQHDISLPIYWGNRNWAPMLGETLEQMGKDGIKHALAFVTSAYSSYSGCRQYREDIEQARSQAGCNTPVVTKLRVFFDHPRFLEANELRLREALAKVPSDRLADAQVAFTAHSIPVTMAAGCEYFNQLTGVAKELAQRTGMENWNLVFQSRSGPASQAWLEPDINDHIRALHASGTKDLVVAPIGFVSDHMEILYDLDTEAAALCKELGINVVRAKTAGTHPAFVTMVRELICEALNSKSGASSDPFNRGYCTATCCARMTELSALSAYQTAKDR